MSRIRLSGGLQLLSSYTIDQEVYDTVLHRYVQVDNRLNLQIRRMRMTVQTPVVNAVTLTVTGAMDLVGRDVLAGTEGGANNGGSPQFRLWDAFVKWKVFHDKEILHLSAGYLPPQVGRENITSALKSPSIEKAWSQFYLRDHLTGTSPGRLVGVHAGGLFTAGDHLYLGYDLGILNPAFSQFGTNSSGLASANLYAGRLFFQVGQPEITTWSAGRSIIADERRRGISFGISGAVQGRTGLIDAQGAGGADFRLAFGAFHADGDWTFLWRHANASVDGRSVAGNAQTGYVRLAYRIPLHHDDLFEPVLMYVLFDGEKDASGQADAAALRMPSGKDETLDFGINYHFNSKLKLALHYVVRAGNAGASAEGPVINNYFAHPAVGAIHVGDWIGFGLTALFSNVQTQ